MKKKIGIMLLAATLLFAGCQSGTQTDAPAPTKVPEATKTVQPEGEDNSTETPNVTKAPDAIDSPVATATPTPTTAPVVKETEPKLYERMAAWDDFYKEYGCYYTAIQIEDMFFYPGMLGRELAEVVSTSNDGAIIPVSLEKLVNPDPLEESSETQKVTYLRNEVPWFDVYVKNYTEDLLPYGECIVTAVAPCDAAVEYCRFFDGNYSMNTIRKIKYTEYDMVKASLKEFGYTMEKEGEVWQIFSADEFCPASLSEKVIYWTNHTIITDLKINMDTGFVSEVDYARNNFHYSNCEIYSTPIPKSFDWASPEREVQLTEIGKKLGDEINKDVIKAAETVEIVSVFRKEQDDSIICVYRTTNKKLDIPVTYVVCRFYHLGLDCNGNIVKAKKWYDPFNNSIYTEYSYMQALKKIDEWNKNGNEIKLMYEYDEDVIKEYKVMKSFSDLSTNQLLALVEQGAKIAPHDAPWGEEVKKVPVYITFGDSEKESGDFEGNRLWLIYVVSYSFLGDKIEQLAYVELHDMYVDVESGEAGFRNSYAEKGRNGKSYTEMKTMWQLNGTPENNIWVTELLPRTFAQKILDEYQYQLDAETFAP